MPTLAHSESGVAVFGLYARVAAAAVIAVALAAGAWRCYSAGKAAVRAEWQADIAERTAQALAASETNRLRERAMQRTKDEAINAAEKRATIFRRDADAVAVERNGLRDDLAASRSGIAAASCDSVRQRAATLTDVFEQCAERYSGMAKKADGHASDSLTLQQAWPKP